MRALFMFGLVFLLGACPTNDHEKASSLPPCSKFGDNCEFAPGKLGSCVVKDGCTAGNCFVCQSQH
ncbi:MAG TPA: hypothetical protein VHV51_21545 [Polyangiaceae bacterium]|jgi:hypothetical protein|nr:hypothetical protein [Polyangiaceae bacterium]